MKAIILAAGIGKRLRPLTNKAPKCLVEINGKAILSYLIENLLYYGIKDIIFAVGYLDKSIKKFMAKNFPQVNATYINNPKYESTNTIYSLWLLKDVIDDDMVLVHGDMIFEKMLLGKLLKHKSGSYALVNNEVEPPEKDFKVKIENSLIKKIGVNITGKNAFFLPPIYKIAKNEFIVWMNEIEKFVKEGNTEVYAENAFNRISGEIKLHPAYFGEEFCMEIDDFKDLEIAESYFKHRK